MGSPFVGSTHYFRLSSCKTILVLPADITWQHVDSLRWFQHVPEWRFLEHDITWPGLSWDLRLLRRNIVTSVHPCQVVLPAYRPTVTKRLGQNGIARVVWLPFQVMAGWHCDWNPTWRTTIHWLVVWNIVYFPIYWVANHPNWRTHIFQRGGPTTNQSSMDGKLRSTFMFTRPPLILRFYKLEKKRKKKQKKRKNQKANQQNPKNTKAK